MKILLSLIFLICMFSSCHPTPRNHSEVHWKPYNQQALDDAVAHHKPVVIDFFAEWCPVCHDLDRTLFSLPEIQAKLNQVITLRVDSTNQDDPEVQRICQLYQIEGLPTIIFLDSHGQEINNSRVIGFVTPEEFSQALAMFRIFKNN